jgi:hypothetical protein
VPIYKREDVNDTVRDILYALRTFKRAPLVAFTIVSTVALGLGLVAVAFTVLNALLFRVDAVPDVDEMFAVRPQASGGEREPFTRAQFETLRRETDVLATPTRNSHRSIAGSTGARCLARSSQATSSRCSVSTPRWDAR